MRNVLADLALESEAATALTMRLARRRRPAVRGDDSERRSAGSPPPVGKYWVCKRDTDACRRRRWSAWAATGTSRIPGCRGYYREAPLNVDLPLFVRHGHPAVADGFCAPRPADDRATRSAPSPREPTWGR